MNYSTEVALCPNTEEIHIYGKANGEDVTKWELEHVLSEHDLVVSGIDWHPVSNQIVSCSHDRNAFVWTVSLMLSFCIFVKLIVFFVCFKFKDGKWNPSICILRINRAATDVKWSPDGNFKF
jgi:actin related protein 2/3 complex subunit 1A/1B